MLFALSMLVSARTMAWSMAYSLTARALSSAAWVLYPVPDLTSSARIFPPALSTTKSSTPSLFDVK